MFIHENIYRPISMPFMLIIEILIEIQTLATYAGSLPAKQHKMVLEWAKDEAIKKFLQTNFDTLNPNLRR